MDKIFIQKECEKEIIWLVSYHESYDSWLVSSITFNFHFEFALCFKHVFSKLYTLVCVYVPFRIWGTTKEALITNWWKWFWQTCKYTPHNMSNLQKLQRHIIIVQMDYHWNLLVRVLLRVGVRATSLTFHFWTNTHFVSCISQWWIFHATFL